MRSRRESDEEHGGGTHAWKLTWAIALVAACRHDVESVDGAFYDGDHRRVHCALNLDGKAGNMSSVDEALDRARDRGEVIELYAHKPGGTVAVADIEHVLAGAVERGLAFYTYADFVLDRPIQGGLALSFDDAHIIEWFALREMFQQYGAHVTFYLTRYLGQASDKKAMMRMLADDGHDIAAHGVAHVRAPSYVEENGLGAYMKNEAVPSIDVLRDDGYPVWSYAYPFGARTSELDDALLDHVGIVRSVSFSLEGVIDPCPQ